MGGGMADEENQSRAQRWSGTEYSWKQPRNGRGVTNAEISRKLGLPKESARYILRTIEKTE